MFNKKGQAALEFLMTYGWAILVVLAAIGALAYFGVLSPDRFLPEKCTLPSGIACLDFTHDGTDFTLIIQNAGGFDMTGAAVSVNGTGCEANSSAVVLPDGEKATFTVTCSPSAGKFKGDLEFVFTNSQTGLTHTKTGELIAKIT